MVDRGHEVPLVALSISWCSLQQLAVCGYGGVCQTLNRWKDKCTNRWAVVLRMRAGSPEDVDLQLMKLYVNQSSGSPQQPQPLAAGGASSDPLDTRLAWLLTTVLAAVGAVSPAVAHSPQVCAPPVQGSFPSSCAPMAAQRQGGICALSELGISAGDDVEMSVCLSISAHGRERKDSPSYQSSCLPS